MRIEKGFLRLDPNPRPLPERDVFKAIRRDAARSIQQGVWIALGIASVGLWVLVWVLAGWTF